MQDQPTASRVLKHPLTSFKMGLLSVLSWDKRPFGNIGAHPSHKRRALRELQEDGLVTRSMHDVWSITRLGRVAFEADRNCDGTSAERLRIACRAVEAER